MSCRCIFVQFRVFSRGSQSFSSMVVLKTLVILVCSWDDGNSRCLYSTVFASHKRNPIPNIFCFPWGLLFDSLIIWKCIFNFQIVGDFSYIFLLLISGSVLLGSENNILCYFRYLFLWTSIWSISLNIPCVLEKNMYCAVVKGSALWMLIRSSWLIVLFRTWISLLIFFLLDLLIPKRYVLRSPSIIMNLSTPFRCIHFCFMYFECIIRCSYAYNF